jgi:GTP cyclohydrolase II
MTGIIQVGPLWRIASARMPTKWGMFDAVGFERDVSNGTRRVETALAIVMGDLAEGVPLLRIHSQCFTGEVLGSLRCDCHDQLEMAMQAIAEEGRGLVIYEYQECRGIGLMAKLEAYELQDAGLDTVEANHALGFKADCRDFSLPAAILDDLGIKRVRLLSNNPRSQRISRERRRSGRPARIRSSAKSAFVCLSEDQKGKTRLEPSPGERQDPNKRSTCGASASHRVRPCLSPLAAITTERPMSPGVHAALRPRDEARRGVERWMKSLRNDPKASFAFN